MTKIQIRRGATSQWVSAATVLAAGEPGQDTTTGIIKIGDGSTAWASLLPTGGPTQAIRVTDATSTTLSGTLVAGHLTPIDATAGAAARTLPAASSVAAGGVTAVKKADTSTNAVTVSRAGSDVIFGTGSGGTSRTVTLPGEAVVFTSNGVNAWTVMASDTPLGQLDLRYSRLLITDATSTAASGTLVAWHLTPVDATSAPSTWTLPAANSVTAGVETAVKKADTSANTVTVSRAGSDLIFGTGSGGTTKVLTLAGEAVTLVSDGVSKWTVQTSDTPSGVLASTYVQKLAVPTGVSATDCANFTAALAALPATGGRIILQPQIGGLSYDFTNGVTINKACIVEGAGAPDANQSSSPTQIVCTSATATPITVTANAVTLRDFGLKNTAGTTPSAGAGISVPSGGKGMRYERVTVEGFYHLVDHNAGANAVIRDSIFLDSHGDYGVRWNSYDSVIDGGIWRQTIPVVHTNLLIETGQGIKIGNSKFLAGSLVQDHSGSDGTCCIDIVVPNGSLLLDTLIHNNSIEGFGYAAIKLGNTTTGQIARMQIVDNQFGTDGSLYGVRVVNGSASAADFLGILVDGNNFAACTTEISMVNCDRVTVGTNNTSAVSNLAVAPSLTSCTNVALTTVQPQTFGGAIFPTDIPNSASGGLRSDVVKIVVPFPCVATGIAMWVAALGAQGSMDVAIYDAAGTTRLAFANNPLYSTFTAAAVNVVPFTASVRLSPGVYWIGCCSNFSGNTYGIQSGSSARSLCKQLIAQTGPMPSNLNSYTTIYAGRPGVALVLE